MRPGSLAWTALLLLLASPAHAADPLSEARRLYNAGQYEIAERYAREATGITGLANAAQVVLARIKLERYRQTARPDDLSTAREALRRVDAGPLDDRERLELTVGQAELLYLDDRFGVSAELFEFSLDRSVTLGAVAHERVLDWWATALDRYAQSRPPDDRAAVYARVLERMGRELALDAGSTPAGYWLAASARGVGDLERAWHACLAGWVRAGLAHDRGAALRADLDRLMTQGIIPERAAKLQTPDTRQTQSGMQNEWDAFKADWSRE